MTCDEAGVNNIYIAVYAESGDATPSHSVSVECDVDENGERVGPITDTLGLRSEYPRARLGVSSGGS
jgi:hypothetical protein